MINALKKGMLVMLLIGVSLIVGILTSELILRWLVPVYSPSGRVTFQCVDGGYRGIPNSETRQWTNTGEFDVRVSINQYGFRDDKDLSQADVEAIFAVGDSFTFGQGVMQSQRFTEILERRLQRDVYNLGIPNNLDGYRYSLEYARSLGADVKNVIVGVSMENDLALYPKELTRCQSSQELSWWNLVINPRSISTKRIKLSLTAHSALYAFVSSVIQQNKGLRNFAVGLGLVTDNQMFTGLSEYNDMVLRSSTQRLIALSKEYNVVVVIIPSRGLWQGKFIEQQDKIHTRVIHLLRKYSVKVLDLRQIFEAHEHPLSRHFLLEGHWNERGHQLAADGIVAHLNQMKLFHQN